jgi:hypothetical protein
MGIVPTRCRSAAEHPAGRVNDEQPCNRREPEWASSTPHQRSAFRCGMTKLVAGIASVFAFRCAPQILANAPGDENGHVVHDSRALAVFAQRWERRAAEGRLNVVAVLYVD